MTDWAGQKKLVVQNLKDAGCVPELIERFLVLLEEGKTSQVLDLLAKHRRVLLECCHAEQKKIDCLDYFIYQIQKEQN